MKPWLLHFQHENYNLGLAAMPLKVQFKTLKWETLKSWILLIVDRWSHLIRAERRTRFVEWMGSDSLPTFSSPKVHSSLGVPREFLVVVDHREAVDTTHEKWCYPRRPQSRIDIKLGSPRGAGVGPCFLPPLSQVSTLSTHSVCYIRDN